MQPFPAVLPHVIVGSLSIVLMSASFAADSPSETNAGDQAESRPGNVKADSADAKDDEVPRVSLAVARDRAKLLQDVYSSTLDVMHHRYFHNDRAVVPARAMEDVFATLERQSHIQARWIAVNLKAMSIDHEPETKFEKQAAREIASGNRTVEIVEDGYYRRAVAIPLQGGCVSCHGGFFKMPSSTPKFAGLIVSVPVAESEGDSAAQSAAK